MKRLHEEASFALHHTGLLIGRRQAVVTGWPAADLSAEQAARRDDLLDRGQPFTCRTTFEGEQVILREHACGRLELLRLATDGTLAVIRILRDPVHVSALRTLN